MQKTKDPSPEHCVDLAELLSRLENDRELLRDLVLIFKEDFPRHLQALREAVERRDMKQTMVVSHTLRGMLSNLAVTKAAASVGQLEQLAGSGGEAALDEALAAFEREVQGLLPEMETYLGEVQN